MGRRGARKLIGECIEAPERAVRAGAGPRLRKSGAWPTGTSSAARWAYAKWIPPAVPRQDPVPSYAGGPWNALSIVAYKQPISRSEGGGRSGGVNVDGVLRTLLDRNLIRIAGRGGRRRPAAHPLCDDRAISSGIFGLNKLSDLPQAGRIERIAEGTGTSCWTKTMRCPDPSLFPGPDRGGGRKKMGRLFQKMRLK